tara:strand:+ start:4813 stop:7482 length:2670 start_codon:yes stop_codon:yes gene_type:complete
MSHDSINVRNIRVIVDELVRGLDGILAFNLSAVVLSDNYTPSEQLTVLWVPPYVTDANGTRVELSTLGKDGIYAATILPRDSWAFLRNSSIVQFSEAIISTTPVVVDGVEYFRPALKVSPLNPMFINRTTPVRDKRYTALFSDKIEAVTMNSNPEQMLFRVQEVYAAAAALVEVASYSGNIGNIDLLTLAGMEDTLIDTDLPLTATLRWDGLKWAQHRDATSDFADVDPSGAQPGQVLTWDGTEFVPQDQQSGPLANVNSVNGQSGIVTLTTSDLANTSGFITDAGLPTNNSSFTNDVNYIVESQAPVTSVNGEAGGAQLEFLTNLTGFDDVNIPTDPVDGQTLIWSGSTWIAGEEEDAPNYVAPYPPVYMAKQGFALSAGQSSTPPYDNGYYVNDDKSLIYPPVEYEPVNELTYSVPGYPDAQDVQVNPEYLNSGPNFAYTELFDPNVGNRQPWENPSFPKWLVKYSNGRDNPGISGREDWNYPDSTHVVGIDPSSGLQINWNGTRLYDYPEGKREMKTGNYSYNPYTNLYKPEYTCTVLSTSTVYDTTMGRAGNRFYPSGPEDNGSGSQASKEGTQYIGTWYELNTSDPTSTTTFNPGSNSANMPLFISNMISDNEGNTYASYQGSPWCEATAAGVIPPIEIWNDMEDLTGGCYTHYDKYEPCPTWDYNEATNVHLDYGNEDVRTPWLIAFKDEGNSGGPPTSGLSAMISPSITLSNHGYGFIWNPTGPGAIFPILVTNPANVTYPQLNGTSQLPFGEPGQPTIADWLSIDIDAQFVPTSFDAWGWESSRTPGTGNTKNWWEYSLASLKLSVIKRHPFTLVKTSLEEKIMPALHPSTYAETLMPDIDFVDGSGEFQFMGPSSTEVEYITYTYTKKSDPGTSYHPDAI